MGLVEVFEDEPQLQSDVGEHERFEHHIHRVPHVAFLQPGLVPGAQRAVADDEPGDHHREHARTVELLGDEERGERHHQPLNGFQTGVCEMVTNPQRHVAEPGADHCAQHRAVAEEQHRVVDE